MTSERTLQYAQHAEADTLGIKACESLQSPRKNAYTCPDTALTGGQTCVVAKASALPLWLKPRRCRGNTLLKAGSEQSCIASTSLLMLTH